MTVVTVIGLGSRTACDDEAGLLAAARVGERLGERVRVVLAGRPGPGLLDLLVGPDPVVLLDAVRAGLSPGTVIRMPLHELPDASVASHPLSSHALGVAETLRLGRSLGRALPPGELVGIEAVQLSPGGGLSAAVQAGLEAMVDAAVAAVASSSAHAVPARSPDRRAP